jgi:hypothetical protein
VSTATSLLNTTLSPPAYRSATFALSRANPQTPTACNRFTAAITL